jgi:hypothetical protein
MKIDQGMRRPRSRGPASSFAPGSGGLPVRVTAPDRRPGLSSRYRAPPRRQATGRPGHAGHDEKLCHHCTAQRAGPRGSQLRSSTCLRCLSGHHMLDVQNSKSSRRNSLEMYRPQPSPLAIGFTRCEPVGTRHFQASQSATHRSPSSTSVDGRPGRIAIWKWRLLSRCSANTNPRSRRLPSLRLYRLPSSRWSAARKASRTRFSSVFMPSSLFGFSVRAQLQSLREIQSISAGRMALEGVATFAGRAMFVMHAPVGTRAIGRGWQVVDVMP